MIKWIGQHIWDFVSRFRNDIYMENIPDGTIASGKNLGLDTDNKVVKSASPSGSIDLTSEVTGTLPVGSGGTGQTTLADDAILTGNGSSGITAEADASFNGGALELTNSSSGLPNITLTNSNSDDVAPNLLFQKTDNGTTGDDLGEFLFRGKDAGGGVHTFASVLAEIADATAGQEAGRFSFNVAEFDGTLTRALLIDGNTDANGEVDVTIAAGSGSTTTVAGKLTVSDVATFQSGIDGDGNDAGNFATYTASNFFEAPIFRVVSNQAGSENFTSAIADARKPKVFISNSNADAFGGTLNFYKAAPGADNDECGVVHFYGQDEGGGQHTFGQIISTIADATPGEEAGKLEFKVAEYDGTVTTGILINGDTDADGEVDVTLGAGAASTTTIAGDLDIDGDKITTAGNIEIETGGSGNIVLDAQGTTTIQSAGLIKLDGEGGVEIENGGSASALLIDNNTVNQQALNIDASNTTSHIVDINAQALTTGTGIYMDSNSLVGGGKLIEIDWDLVAAADGDTQHGIYLDIDKSGNVASGEFNTTYGTYISFNDNGTNVGYSTFTGHHVSITDANADGTNYRRCFRASINGGDSLTAVGFYSDVEDGAYDFFAQSSADGNDYGYWKTGANGATTLGTNDNGGEAAHFEINAEGNIILDATGDIALEAAGGDVTGDAQNYTFTSSVSAKPSLSLINTNADANGPELIFDKTSVAGADNDDIGKIKWNAEDDGGGGPHTFGQILGEIAEASTGQAGGKLSLQIASHDGGLENGLVLQDGNADGEVDVTIGAGSNAAVVSSGTLKAGGGTLSADASGATTGGRLLLLEGSDNGTNYVGFTAPAAIGSNIAWQLPAADGNANEVLQTNGSGVLTWAAAGSVSVTDNNSNTDFSVVFCDGDTLHDDSGVFTYNPSTGKLLLNSQTSDQPVFELRNTNNDANGTVLMLHKLPSTANDNDDIGTIQFRGISDDGDSTTTAQNYGQILVESTDVTTTSVNSSMKFKVTATNAVTGLTLAGSSTVDEVDVTVGSGTSSLTTVAGDLKVSGNDIKDDDGTTCITFDSSGNTEISGNLIANKRKFAIPSDGAGNADGDVVYIGTGSTVAGKIYYYKSDGSWGLTNSDDPSTATGWLAVALGDDPDVTGMLVRGTVDLAEDIVGTEALGSIIYLDKATTGAATTAAPTATGDIVRVIGYALTTGNANKIWFSPDNTWVEHV